MPDNEMSPDPDVDPIAELRARADALEHRLAETQKDARSRLIRAELKVEAVRAGMVDLDGLKLFDLGDVQLNADGEIVIRGINFDGVAANTEGPPAEILGAFVLNFDELAQNRFARDFLAFFER